MEIILEKRAQHIREIEKELAEINEIYKGLGDLVRDHGDRLDTIEDNLENSIKNCEHAMDELETASNYNKLHNALMYGLGCGLVAGPIGLLVGIKSSVVLLSLSIGSGYLGYKITRVI